MTADRVAVVIPTIPPRIAGGYLGRAVGSVLAQTYPVAHLSIAVDLDHEGAWATRGRALAAVDDSIDWVQFLDDDDTLDPTHVEQLHRHAVETGADYVFSWFRTSPPGGDCLGHFGKVFDAAAPHHTTMMVLVRRALAQQVGFTPPLPDQDAGGEDWRFLLGCLARNARVSHYPARTWTWQIHGAHTSGLPW
jgi:glycosyltransferase involved in cell wall biosynthesis